LIRGFADVFLAVLPCIGARLRLTKIAPAFIPAALRNLSNRRRDFCQWRWSRHIKIRTQSHVLWHWARLRHGYHLWIWRLFAHRTNSRQQSLRLDWKRGLRNLLRILYELL